MEGAGFWFRMGRGGDLQGLMLVPSPWHGWGAQTYLLAGGGGEAVLEQQATLLTQVLARGARNDPFLVLVTLRRARRERNSAGTDFYWPLGMAQCLGLGWQESLCCWRDPRDLFLDAAAANPGVWENFLGWTRGQRGVG